MSEVRPKEDSRFILNIIMASVSQLTRDLNLYISDRLDNRGLTNYDIKFE